MKFRLLMKSPNIVDSTLYQLTEANYNSTDIAKAKKMMAEILEYKEYLTVEVDTNKETYTVLKKDRTYFN